MTNIETLLRLIELAEKLPDESHSDYGYRNLAEQFIAELPALRSLLQAQGDEWHKAWEEEPPEETTYDVICIPVSCVDMSPEWAPGSPNPDYRRHWYCATEQYQKHGDYCYFKHPRARLWQYANGRTIAVIYWRKPHDWRLPNVE